MSEPTKQRQEQAEAMARECEHKCRCDHGDMAGTKIAQYILQEIPLAQLLTDQSECERLRKEVSGLKDEIVQLDYERATLRAEGIELCKSGDRILKELEIVTSDRNGVMRINETHRQTIATLLTREAALMAAAKTMLKVNTLCRVRSEPYIPHDTRREIQQMMADALTALTQSGVDLNKV